MARPNVREQIVEAGLEAFCAKGFNGCSVQDITGAAGVPKGSFYNHFDSKEALAAEIIEVYNARNISLAVLGNSMIAPVDRIRSYFSGLSNMMMEAGHVRGCLVGNFSAELSDHSVLIREKLNSVFVRWTGALDVAIREGQRDGSIGRDVDAATLAAVLLDAFEGAMLRARVEKNGSAFENFLNVVFAKLLS